MSYKVFQFGDFSGGLNLRDKADVVKESEAIDLLNVDFTDVGAVRQRDGYVEVTGTALTNRVDSLAPFYKANGTSQLVAGCGTRLEALNSSGAVVASATGLTAGPWVFARFAAPSSEYAYAANGIDTVRRWDGASWTAPANMPKAGSICVLSASNRLVSTGYGTGTTSGPTASASNPSRVHFSNVGAPETWGANDWVDVTPGDGEQVMAAVAFRELVFVFKESKFYVFTGTGTDGGGNPIFNYRPVDTGIGLAARNAVAVARDGVYFMARNGLYRTQGGEPQLLSDKIEPMWLGGAEVYFRSSTINHAQLPLSRLVWHNERLYLSVPTGIATANDRVLVYDIPRGWWSVYDIPMSAVTSWRRTGQPELHFGYSSGANKTGRLSATTPTDAGVAITSRWRSGWDDSATPAEKFTRWLKLWGSGTVLVGQSRDFERSDRASESVILATGTDTWGDGTGTDTWGDGTSDADLWGGAGQISSNYARQSTAGFVNSVEFANAPAVSTWSIHRMERHISAFRE